MQKSIYYLLIFLAFSISGCLLQTEPVAPTSVPTSTIQPISTSMSPLPTLEAEQTKDIVKKYLRDGGDCDEPCFLGIFPEKTTVDEAKSILINLGLPVEEITNDGKVFYNTHYDLDNGLSLTGYFSEQEGIVKNIRIGISPGTQDTGISREWITFSPEMLIQNYGPPSSVSFALDWGPRSYFEMNLYFDAVDMIVDYTGDDLIPRQKGYPLICPLSAEFGNVRIWLGKDPEYPPLEAISLEDATSMTIEEFSNLMTEEPSTACFLVNGDVFP